MRKIYSAYNPPSFVDLTPSGDSITVQGLVTSLSVILNGGDDNNMKTLELGYSEEVRDLYPEMFGRPTKYEMAYYEQQQHPDESVGSSDAPPDTPASSSEPTSAEPTPEK